MMELKGLENFSKPLVASSVILWIYWYSTELWFLELYQNEQDKIRTE